MAQDSALQCVTPRTTAEWILQQLREAFPEPCRYQYVILDRDRKFDAEVLAFLTTAGLKARRTSVRSPWQNGMAERWIGSCRREILDHVIALSSWPINRDFDLFKRWFEYRFHSMLVDLCEDPLECDEL